MPNGLPVAWVGYLSALVLVLVRISGLMLFAPVFSSEAIPARVKALFTLTTAICVAPAVAGLPAAHARLGAPELLGELGVGLLFGICLRFLGEMLTFAGSLLGFSFSFSLVNLLDPNTKVQTALLGQFFGLFGTLVLIASGLDRTMLAALLRTFVVVPVGDFFLSARTAMAVVAMGGGLFLAALQLAAPVMVATMLVDVAAGLAARLSPQLPVLQLTVPVKTLLGFVVLIGSLALWPRFIEARFDGLLHAASTLLEQKAMGA
jgi:flagellar biosynthesis protein FliR